MASNKKGHRRERELLDKMTREGYVVHRIAGSGSKDSAICDLVAVKDGIVHFIEVKSRKKVFYTKSHSEQFEILKKAAKACGAKATLAVKLDYKDWQMIDLHQEIPEKII